MKQLAVMGLVGVLGATAFMDDAEARRRNFNNGANYMGLDYQAQQVKPDGAGEDFSPTAVRFRSGTMYDENFGYEVHLGIGTGSDEQGTTEFEVDHYYGFALRGQMPLSEQFALYGLAGLGWTTYTETNTVTNQETGKTESDFVYGGGVAMRLGRRAMASVEWMSQLSNDDFDISAVNIGIARLF